MATRPSVLNVALGLWFVVASAHVTTFNPRIFDASSGDVVDTDLLVLLAEEGNSSGVKSLATALQNLDQGTHGGLARDRSLEVAQCLGCTSFNQVLGRYHLEPADLPVVLLFPQRSENTRRGKFLLSLKGAGQPLQAMVNFVKAYDDDDLKPWIRSLPAPKADEQHGPVRTVVGSTFEKEIIDSERHVVLLVYSDHDVASRQLQPVFEQIGNLLESNNKKSPFRLKRFDNDLNDVPPSVNLGISHVPQISLFRENEGGDPDTFPEDEKPTMGNVLTWLHEMLPEQNYGLDALFAKVAKAAHTVDADPGLTRRTIEEI